MSGQRTHELKVVEPYFDALLDGSKPFEVRRNDRAFQAGDVLVLREWHPYVSAQAAAKCDLPGCDEWTRSAHWGARSIRKKVTFVYSGDPRFGDLESGFVVLGLSS